MAYTAATSLSQLAAALQEMNYTPRTEAERRTIAENLYKNSLEQAMLSAQQQYDTSNLALQNQLNTLGTNYDRQLEAQREANAQTYSQADRAALQRGMQRSSYNLSRLANIALQGDEALANIQQDRTNAVNNITSQQALLSKQLAQSQASANTQYQNSILAYMQQLEDQDYQRSLTANTNYNNLQMQLYELGLKNGASSSGASSRGGSKGNGDNNPGTNTPPPNVPNNDRNYNAPYMANGSVVSNLVKNLAQNTYDTKLGVNTTPATTNVSAQKSALNTALQNGTKSPMLTQAQSQAVAAKANTYQQPSTAATTYNTVTKTKTAKTDTTTAKKTNAINKVNKSISIKK